ncbi:MAG: SDR family oxidoreductase [Anaerolineae bacterium]|nr:SDR family oxidoreductase [Anaerolineae bacterium]
MDILVNNAGILGNTRPLEEIPADEWDQLLAINVRGVFLCTKAVLPLMKAQRYGKIVNVSSSAGRSTSTFGGAHYTTSKAAILGLTRHTAREAAPYNRINVNATARRGSMDTEMVRERATPEHIAREEQSIPLRRLGTAQDEANLVLFLCSDESSLHHKCDHRHQRRRPTALAFPVTLCNVDMIPSRLTKFRPRCIVSPHAARENHSSLTCMLSSVPALASPLPSPSEGGIPSV